MHDATFKSVECNFLFSLLFASEFLVFSALTMDKTGFAVEQGNIGKMHLRALQSNSVADRHSAEQTQ